MEYSEFLQTLKSELDKHINQNFIIDKKTKSYTFKINDSLIVYSKHLFSIFNKGKLIATDILNYEIALAIAENPNCVSALIQVDNQYAKHYNDMIFYTNSFKKGTDIFKDTMVIRYQESIIEIERIKKIVRSKSRTLKFKQINN